LNKIYTPAEQAYCADNPDHLAGRWAAEEDVIKCSDGRLCVTNMLLHSIEDPSFDLPTIGALVDSLSRQIVLCPHGD
jgi:hypothetical protein